MDRPSKATLARLPLAEATLLLWRWATSEDRLQAIWEKHRGRCYERVVSFALMVRLIADALLLYGSGRVGFQKNREQGELEASLQAAYGKLRRLPIAVSTALLGECSAALVEAFSPWARWRGPASLRKFRVVIIDGKALKHVAKRLKPMRGIRGAALGGRALVALDWSTELAFAMQALPDGEANEVVCVPALMTDVRQRLSGHVLLTVADRAFPAPKHLEELARDGNHFLVRYAKSQKFERDPSRPTRDGQDEQGRKFVESWGWLGGPNHPLRRYVRMIDLRRSGGDNVTLITDLLDAEAYPAVDLLWLYGERWGIERAFQKVTEVFGLQGLIGSTPQACIFQFAFCLLLYNMLLVLRGYVAEAQDLEPEQLSAEQLFGDVERQLIAWNVMIDQATTLSYFAAEPELPTLHERLQALASATWSETWLKSPPQAVHNVSPRQRSNASGHTSVYRVLQAHAQRLKKKKRPPTTRAPDTA